MAADQNKRDSKLDQVTEESPFTMTLENVIGRELEDILDTKDINERAGRREVKGFSFRGVPSDGNDLVGLSLSGGGLRAASFGLGILQAFHKSGLLRFVDYLSTVSGGGYVGSRLSYLYHNGKNPESIERELDTRLNKFLIDGTYLNRPWFFLDRYAIGLLFNNLMIVTALVSAASFIALCFRVVDSPMFARWLQWFLRSLSHNFDAVDLTPFGSDLYRQFFPAVLFFLFWLGGCAVTYLRTKDAGWLLRALLAGTVGSFFVCLVVLLGDGDISRDESSMMPIIGGKPIDNVSSRTFSPILATLVTGLLPLLFSAIRPKTLSRWATRPSNSTGRIIYDITTSFLLFGVPLFAIYFMARENLSGFGTHGIHKVEHFGRFLCGPKPNGVPKVIDDEVQKKLRENLIGSRFVSRDSGIWQRPLESAKLVPGEDPDVSETARRLEDMNLNKTVKKLEFDETHTDVLGESERLMYALNVLLDDDFIARLLQQEDKSNRLALESATVEYAKKGARRSAARKAQAEEKNERPAARDESTEEEKDHTRAVDRLRQLTGRLDAGGWKDLDYQERREFNHLALAVFYPDSIKGSINSYKRKVVYWEDQIARGWVFAVSLTFAVLLGYIVNFNATSLYEFYKRRVAVAFLKISDENGTGGRAARGEPKPVMLKDLDTTSKGGPYPLISASVNQFPNFWDRLLGGEPREAGVRIDSFLLSKHACGYSNADAHHGQGVVDSYKPTKDYQLYSGRRPSGATLADAMTLSGAAFDPLQSGNSLLFFAMAALNLRLGQWLPNPAAPRLRWFSQQLFGHPTPILGLLSGLKSEPENRAWCFVSDGAHFDNTAIWPLLQRRCALIFASDASDDRSYQFVDLLKLLRKARRSLNIESSILSCREGKKVEEIGVDQVRPRALQVVAPPTDSDLANETAPENLVRQGAVGRKDWESSSHYLIIELDYSQAVGVRKGGPDRGLLIYLKPSMTLDEPPDLVGYWERHPNFPQDPTVEQFLDEEQVESYRQLGHHIGGALVRELLAGQKNSEKFNSIEDPGGQDFSVIQKYADQLATRRQGEKKDPQK